VSHGEYPTVVLAEARNPPIESWARDVVVKVRENEGSSRKYLPAKVAGVGEPEAKLNWLACLFATLGCLGFG